MYRITEDMFYLQHRSVVQQHGDVGDHANVAAEIAVCSMSLDKHAIPLQVNC